MSKRDFSFLVIGAVVGLGLAYGVLHFPSAEISEVAEVVEAPEVVEVVEAPEVVEVPEERTVAERIAATEEQIAALEADIEYLKTPLTAARMRQRGLSVMPYLPALWWHALEPCAMSEWRTGSVSLDCTGSHWGEIGRFLSYCTNEPQCKVALDTLIAKRNELGELEGTMFDLELEQAELELDQKMRERERE